ncbi:BMP family ABC transporter substrate-binding protein [Streptomyces sp. DT2A-34]|uniref:BMP family ABC transporter substrate-binding protein n=1 Tax=Streptomyces sp. DT2A-34 TaxID=3051182 RepID=UPI00265BF55F|nr:BMP family ABC transporter substrate-binding protein [Streptomyces sp. DT2A-34]MDO0914299.1 BMP family ABC transporter substrate-binding protein [Streptomyces sp. DT2A-34]
MKLRRTWRGNKRDSKKGPAGKPARKAAVARVMAATAGALRGRRGWAAGGAAVVVVLGVLGAWFLTGGQDGPPDPRARQYTEVDACLLTGEKGIAPGTPAASVWEGMRKASLETRARVNYVPVTGPQSVDNVRPFFNSLIQRQCEVVLAVGTSQVQVTRAAAGKNPDVRFVVVDGTSGTKAVHAGNVTVAKPGGSVKETVAESIRQAVRMAER